MEINARQNLSGPLSCKCGVNFPYLTYMHALTGTLPEVTSQYKHGVYWIDIGKDIAESIRSYNVERYSLGQYITPYLKPHVFTIPSLKDPMPICKRFYDTIQIVFERVIRKLFLKNNSWTQKVKP
jgi:hypothetical protein